MKRDLLTISDFSREEILDLFEKSADLKEKRRKGIQYLPLKGKTLGMIFNKHSTRTRIRLKWACLSSAAMRCFCPAISCN